MEKFKFNMIGGGFQHDVCSCANNTPKHVEWIKQNHFASVSIHIDAAIFNVPVDKNKLNIGWFCESPYFTRPYSQKCDNFDIKSWVLENYKFIFTSDKEIIKKHPEFKYVIPHAYSWIQDRQIFKKTKTTSIIASAKKECPGHILRHIIVDNYKDSIAAFGGGYNPIKFKEEGLSDYMFSFAIENTKCDGYFTEKITDCFSTGTIPIYWGDSTISDYFLTDGIISLEDEFDGSCLTKEFYDSKLDIIKENFDRSMNLPIPEDYIYINYIK